MGKRTYALHQIELDLDMKSVLSLGNLNLWAFLLTGLSVKTGRGGVKREEKHNLDVLVSQ